MITYAMLLDSGFCNYVNSSSHGYAISRVRAWQAARLRALAEGDLAVPRRVVALIRIHQRQPKEAAARRKRRSR